MDRRTFIGDAGGAVLWAAWPATTWIVPALARAVSTSNEPMAATCVAVFDPSLEQGRRLARDAMRVGIPSFAVAADDDVGTLWHECIAPLVGHHTRLVGALRASDAFVLTRLAHTLCCTTIGA